MRFPKWCSLAILPCLLGCEAPTPAINTTWCKQDNIITVSKADVLTPGTAREILLHNEQGTAICGW